MKVEGRVALVTGAAGGIGGALVDSLLKAGVGRIVACDLDGAALSALQQRAPERVAVHPLDVTDENAVEAAAAAHRDTDILINCHGVAVQQSYLEAASLAPFRREMDVNYWGQVLMCRAFAPVLAARDHGALVNLLSPLAHVTFPFVAPYCATKAACRALTDAMRAELAEAGTLVMAVYPGSIDTPMMANVKVTKSGPETVADAVVAGLLGNASEVWAGAGAQDMRAMLESDPKSLYAMAAKQLRLTSINAAGEPVAFDA
jgi:NAD(P)-dependent dehydrogenase (short-subunit alcohol dehydrogenase family)